MKDRDHPYVSAVFLVLAALGIRLALDPVLGDRSPLLIFTAAIVIAAGRYGIFPGLAAMALSLVLGSAVFMAPGFPPVFSAYEIASLAVFLVTSLAMLSFAGHLKESRDRERQLQSALQQVQTETAMGTMAATLAHELNQPLAAAANYIGSTKRIAADLREGPPPALLSGLDDAEAQIHRAGEIIRHARALVAPASSPRQRVSLREMVGNAVKPLRASGWGEMKLRIQIDPSVDEIVVNPIQIEQVLLNLIRNACQAAGSCEAAKIVVSARPGDNCVLVEVRDFGSGISSDRMSSLFSPGTASGTGGLGLGLAISRTIVEAHRGRIWAENNSGGGASFFFTLPSEQAPS